MMVFKSGLCILLAAVGGAATDDAKWVVLKARFSAASIGIAFQDDTTGWTTFTSGSSAPAIVKTTDAGVTWKPVKNTTGVPIGLVTSLAAIKGQVGIADIAVQAILEGDKWSVDGNTFRQSLGAPLSGQDVEIVAGKLGRVVMAGSNGPCFSNTAGALYQCKKVPLKYKGTGRYVSAPSTKVIYFTAGQWPSKSPPGKVPRDDKTYHVEFSRNVRVVYGLNDSHKFELGPLASSQDANSTPYTAELWKSTDGGDTWENLLTDSGNFYFNDIDCFDETHCVAVGEGFAGDGSKSPGARIYTTSDGKTFTVSHTESAKGTESLMAAKMLSDTEHWAGGTQQTGGLLAPAFMLHSKDGGKTYTNDNNGVFGQMITAMDFISPDHAYATTVNALQVSSLLEYTAHAPPPAPGPAPPSPGGQPHYEKPPCQAGEAQASVNGTSGKLCAPPCSASGACPSDKPKDVTATPQCILKDTSGNQYCALTCATDAECDKAGGSSCSMLQAGKGVCTYPGTAVLTTVALPRTSEIVI